MEVPEDGGEGILEGVPEAEFLKGEQVSPGGG